MKENLREFALFLLRVSIGLGLMYHGWLKIENGVDVFADKGITAMGYPFTWNPLLFAWLSTLAELVGGFFCFLGLWTRLAAFAIVVNMSVASFIAMRGMPIIAMSPMTRELPMAYVIISVAVLILGPGRWSVDGARGGGKRSAPKKKK
jgi:putative oxidoreductase